MLRKVTLTAPKQVDENTQITGAELSYCYFHDDAITPYMNGGRLSESIPLEGLLPADRQVVEDFVALLCRLTAEEMETGAAKGRARTLRDAARNPTPTGPQG